METDKEVFVNEILDMDKRFVEKFSDIVEKSPQTKRIILKKRVNNYLNLVKNKKPVKIEIKEKQIESLFNKKIDIDSLIEEIWGS